MPETMKQSPDPVYDPIQIDREDDGTFTVHVELFVVARGLSAMEAHQVRQAIGSHAERVARKLAPTLTTERPDSHGVGYLKLREHNGVHSTEPDVTCNLDFDADGELLGVEFMSWPASVKQHPRTSQNEEVRSTE